MQFADRREAGQALARLLERHRGDPRVVVLGLPRGGVPVAYEVARALGAPLDVFVVRKLGYPGREEYAIGAIASGGVRVTSEDLAALGVPPEAVEAIAQRELAELQRRERLYRGDRPPPVLAGRTVILVDDGLATGSTMRAAAKAVKALCPAKLLIAAPVGAPDTCAALRREADEVVCAATPEPFRAVGLWYADFRQTSDQEVRELLAAAPARADAARPHTRDAP